MEEWNEVSHNVQFLSKLSTCNIPKRCPYCNKEITKRGKRIYCSLHCSQQMRYKKNIDKIKQREKIYRLNHKEESKKKFKEWYTKNRERQNENVKKDYKRNIHKWNERDFVKKHRKQIILILGNKCYNCGKEGIKEIHHERYKHLPRKILKCYCRYLKVFCSRECHRKYETDKLNK